MESLVFWTLLCLMRSTWRMTYKILISAPYFQPVIEDYRDTFEKYDMELLVPDVN